MENEFAKVMSERTDEDLIKIVTVERENYNSTAIEAADADDQELPIRCRLLWTWARQDKHVDV